MDFHIPRRYGFRQVYGENGGPGGMFHTLRNLGPTLHIVHRMEELCPDAWLINYTNPEAKLVEAVCKLTKIHAVGVWHGFDMGVAQIAKMLERKQEELAITGYGLNHFGWITSIFSIQYGKKRGRQGKHPDLCMIFVRILPGLLSQISIRIKMRNTKNAS